MSAEDYEDTNSEAEHTVNPVRGERPKLRIETSLRSTGNEGLDIEVA